MWSDVIRFRLEFTTSAKGEEKREMRELNNLKTLEHPRAGPVRFDFDERIDDMEKVKDRKNLVGLVTYPRMGVLSRT